VSGAGSDTHSIEADVVPGRHLRPWLLALFGYAALTVMLTWPLVVRLPAVLPHDVGDPVLNVWILWWDAHVAPLTERWWNSPMFWPSPGTLAFSETLLGLTPITTPIQWLGGSAVTAHNVALLLTFPLSALAAHALVYRLSGRHDAGLVAGLVYGFNPYRVAHIPHIQVLASFWMPVALLGLHEFAASKRPRWLVVFAAAWLMQALSNGYYLLFFPVLIGIWVLWFLGSRKNLGALWAVAGVWMVASLPLAPILYTYQRVVSANGFGRSGGEVLLYSADLVSFVRASALLRFWNLGVVQQAENQLFPGLTAVLLVVLAVAGWVRRAPRPTSTPRPAVFMLLLALAFILAALIGVVIGPWDITIGSVTLVSVHVASKPLSMGVLCFVLGLFLEPRVAAAVRRRSPLMFYLLAMAALYLLALGPRPQFLGAVVLYRGPYSWLMSLPGYQSVRAAARFAMLAILCLSVAAALAFAKLTAGTRPTWRRTLAAVLIAGILGDSWFSGLPLPDPPMRLRALEARSNGAAVLELPFGEPGPDLAAMFRSMYHGRPTVNGYSGFFPKSFEFLAHELGEREPQIFDALAAWGPLVVLVNRRRDVGEQWQNQLAERAGTVPLGADSDYAMYRLAGAELAPDAVGGRRLSVQSASANVRSDEIRLAFDGNPETRWTSGPQTGTEMVTLDLGSRQIIDGLIMTVGRFVLDFPRTLVIETGDDGREWVERWRGHTLPVAFAGMVRHPLQVPLVFALPEVPARFLRLRQVDEHPAIYYWSITELSVFGH
jgi:hypothetical protein